MLDLAFPVNFGPRLVQGMGTHDTRKHDCMMLNDLLATTFEDDKCRISTRGKPAGFRVELPGFPFAHWGCIQYAVGSGQLSFGQQNVIRPSC